MTAASATRGWLVRVGLDLAEARCDDRDLDLLVGAAEVAQLAVRKAPGEVAGAIEPVPGGPPWIGHEAAGGQLGLAR